MAKLHELLAVESDQKNQAGKILAETSKVFNNEHLFQGFLRTLEITVDGIEDETPDERHELTTTVPERLQYTAGHLAKYIDILFKKELTNQEAKADLVVDGKVLAADVPATFLLGLESRLKEIRAIFAEVPSLQAGIAWEPAPDIGPHVHQRKYPEEQVKTRKQFRHQILVEPTEHHPAQIEKWEEQTPIGVYKRSVWSGKITSAQKADMLNRLDTLIQYVKTARQRANTQDVVQGSIGKKLFDYILDGVV